MTRSPEWGTRMAPSLRKSSCATCLFPFAILTIITSCLSVTLHATKCAHCVHRGHCAQSWCQCPPCILPHCPPCRPLAMAHSLPTPLTRRLVSKRPTLAGFLPFTSAFLDRIVQLVQKPKGPEASPRPVQCSLPLAFFHLSPRHVLLVPYPPSFPCR